MVIASIVMYANQAESMMAVLSFTVGGDGSFSAF